MKEKWYNVKKSDFQFITTCSPPPDTHLIKKENYDVNGRTKVLFAFDFVLVFLATHTRCASFPDSLKLITRYHPIEAKWALQTSLGQPASEELLVEFEWLHSLNYISSGICARIHSLAREQHALQSTCASTPSHSSWSKSTWKSCEKIHPILDSRQKVQS